MIQTAFGCGFFLLLPLPSLHFELGMKALDEGHNNLAIACYTACILENPKDTQAFYYRGAAYLFKYDNDRAINDFSKAISLDPESPSAFAFFNRAIAHYSKRDYKNAIKDCSEGVRLAPTNADAFHFFALLLATCPNDDLRDTKRAVQLATTACDLSGWNDPRHLNVLAVTYAQCEDYREAVKWQKKAIEVGLTDKDEQQQAIKTLKEYEKAERSGNH